MAQWIPKTAWKVSNLNKRYGTPYLSGGKYPHLQPELQLESYAVSLGGKTDQVSIQKKILAALTPNPAGGNPYPGAVVIDLRDLSERTLEPLESPAVVSLHHHDLLSGAALPILPRDKANAELFLVSPNSQRAVNSMTALRQWGYRKVYIADASVIAPVVKDVEKKIV
ncbi:hypothetical protein AGDE_11863 [Angomonas deanei]|nr:hypothetical protein AGDE_12110 [Angomonas deanei]EPY25344.1 hypothetical protein AGDE_11863 [Angomonas deanei]|eukprot:EPY24911.1 hypothetical protein AGDE_12110 [Angomonas deanei]